MKLKTLTKMLPKAGVYALVYGKRRRVLVSHSSNILLHVVKLVNTIETSKHYSDELKSDLDNLDIKLLEECDDETTRRLLVSKYVNMYSKLGYKHYVKYNFPIYNPVVKVESVDGKNFARVYLVSSRSNRLLVGEFLTILEAKDWVKKHYPKDKPIECIVKNLINV